MNKYALIIAAVATFGGISNAFSQGKFSSAGEFCDAMVKEHPKKLAVAGVFTGMNMAYNCARLFAADPIRFPRANYLWEYKNTNTNIERNAKRYRLGFPMPTISAGIIIYSALKTAYGQSQDNA